MFRNYLKAALRNLKKSKGFSTINIAGLAIGLATCLLIIIYVMDELSYDRYNKHAAEIYRVDGDIRFGGKDFIAALQPPGVGPAMVQDYPGVLQYTRFRDNGGFLVRKGNQNIQEEKVIRADSTLFEVFTLPLIAGDPRTALRAPHTVVITEKMARKYFNGTDVVGKTLLTDDSIPYKVTGVLKNIPAQSHFDFDFFVAMAGLEESRKDDQWLSSNFNTYVLLKEGTDPVKLQAKLYGIAEKYMAPLLKSAVGESLQDFEKGGGHIRFALMPLTAIHLHSNKLGELGPNGSIQYVYIFSAIALFILLIACVNFMNLSTARSANRAKEVGVRKVLGSLRSNLITQFIVESLLMSLLAMVLALVIALVMLPYFNQLAGKEMSIVLFARPWLAPSLLGLVLVVGLLAGSYPAFFLSSFRPIAVLKGKMKAGFKGGGLRNILVVFQFGISIFLIVGTAVIYNQLNYIRSKKLGYDRDHVLVIKNTWSLGKGAKSFKEELKRMPGITAATISSYLPASGNRNQNAFFLTPGLDTKQGISMQSWWVDEEYIPALGMEMVKGRNFSRTFSTDSQAVIINESAARLMGSLDATGLAKKSLAPESMNTALLNKNIYEIEDLEKRTIKTWHIIGVVKDFNFSSLREVVTPLAFFPREDLGAISLRLHTNDMTSLIRQIGNRWKAIAPGQPFTYSFMDEDFNAVYKAEQRTGNISLTFSLLAICIACLGLFGLATYAAEQRIKEIGIRKVLGATVANIFTLLSRDFLKLVVIAALIAFPFSWWAMHNWLMDFAYRVNIGWEVFGLAAILAAGIALFTISFQALKAALANPVRSLRSE